MSTGPWTGITIACTCVDVTSILLMAVAVLAFARRTYRYAHHVSILGLLGAVAFLPATVVETVINITGLSTLSAALGVMCIHYILTAISAVCLYVHFLLKTRLLSTDRRWTKLQITSAVLISALPTLYIAIVTLWTIWALGDTLHEVLTEWSTAIMAILDATLYILNFALPALAFFEQSFDFFKKRCELLEPREGGGRQSLTRWAFLQAVLRDVPATVGEEQSWSIKTWFFVRASQRTSDLSGGPDQRRRISALSQTQQRVLRHLMRVIRRVLIATIGSFATTGTTYSLAVSGALPVQLRNPMMVLDFAVSWGWSVFASPLPHEESKDGATWWSQSGPNVDATRSGAARPT